MQSGEPQKTLDLCSMCKLFMDCGCLRVVLVHIDRRTDRLLCEAIKINCPNKTRNRNKQNNSHRQTKLCVARIWANSFYLYTYLCVYTCLYICKNLRTYLANSMPKAKNELAIFGWEIKTVKNIIN